MSFTNQTFYKNEIHRNLKHGTINISSIDTEYLFDDLITFGSRMNPKRKYIIISKVLGRYIPCAPSIVNEYHAKLVEKIAPLCSQSKSILAVGFAETAISLGGNIAKNLQQSLQDKSVTYNHTTRYIFQLKELVRINEQHCHAPNHVLYEPYNYVEMDFDTIVLIDDEITTGNTIFNLSTELLNEMSNTVKKLIWVSLASFMPNDKINFFKQEMLKRNIDFEHVSLINGLLSFTDTSTEDIQLPDDTITETVVHDDVYHEYSRTGYQMLNQHSYHFLKPDGSLLGIKDFDTANKYVIIGNGEFSHHPFLFAHELESNGLDVLFQFSGRTPLFIDGAIEKIEEFFDEVHDGKFYIYNRDESRIPILLYETMQQFINCKIKEKLNIIPGILEYKELP